MSEYLCFKYLGILCGLEREIIYMDPTPIIKRLYTKYVGNLVFDDFVLSIDQYEEMINKIKEKHPDDELIIKLCNFLMEMRDSSFDNDLKGIKQLESEFEKFESEIPMFIRRLHFAPYRGNLQLQKDFQQYFEYNFNYGNYRVIDDKLSENTLVFFFLYNTTYIGRNEDMKESLGYLEDFLAERNITYTDALPASVDMLEEFSDAIINTFPTEKQAIYALFEKAKLELMCDADIRFLRFLPYKFFDIFGIDFNNNIPYKDLKKELMEILLSKLPTREESGYADLYLGGLGFPAEPNLTHFDSLKEWESKQLSSHRRPTVKSRGRIPPESLREKYIREMNEAEMAYLEKEKNILEKLTKERRKFARSKSK